MINPIAPHWSEYMYRTYLNPIFKKHNLNGHTVEFLAFDKFPTVTSHVDSKLFHYNRYIKTIIKQVNDVVNSKLALANKGKKDPKKGKNETEPEATTVETTQPKQPEVYNGKLKVLYATNFTNEQRRVYEMLNSAVYDDSNVIKTDYKKQIMNEMATADPNLRTSTLQFASFIVKEIETYGKESLTPELPFSEVEALNDNMSLIKKLTKASNIELIEYDEKTKPKGVKSIAIPGKPIIYGDDK